MTMLRTPVRKPLHDRFRLWAFYTYYNTVFSTEPCYEARFVKALAASIQPVPSGTLEAWDRAMKELTAVKKTTVHKPRLVQYTEQMAVLRHALRRDWGDDSIGDAGRAPAYEEEYKDEDEGEDDA